MTITHGFNKGDRVRLNQRVELRRAGNDRFDSEERNEGSEYEVTQVFPDRLVIRTLESEYDARVYSYRHKSFRCPVDYIVSSGARRLGTKPEDTDEQTYIGIDHPGIQWLWDDLATYAKGKGWCGTYDELAEYVGIPGRKRSFNARHTINGIAIMANIEARSQSEADQLLAATVASQTPSAQG